jgi:putative lumazine-binding protein
MKTSKMRLRIFLVLLCSTFFFDNASAQSDEAAIKATIMTMFDGMRAGDSTMVHSAFGENEVMKTIGRDRTTGKAVVRESGLDGFLKSVGTPHDAVWDEKVLSFDIKIDQQMATAWVPYEFYLGDKFLHCGVNHFTLFKGEKGWKIIYLIDTRKQEGCK